jgi:hypothetical protein
VSLANDRVTTSIQPDDKDPTFSFVEFSDGSSETMPTSQAEALPAAAPAPIGAPLAANGEPPLLPGELAAMGAAEPASGDPVAFPNALAQQWEAAGQDPIVQANESGIAPPGYTGMGMPGGETNPNAPRVDYGEIVAPGSPGGFGVAGQTSTTSTSQQQTVDDPSVMQGRVDEAINADAQAAFDRDTAAFESKATALQNESMARDAQEQQLRQEMRRAELERAEHEKMVKAIEATPVDEDAFWSDSPARTAGAWIALALSGFLQGATRGQNPALNQMVQALNHAQDRYIQTQLRQRDSSLQTRIKLMGDKQNAIDSLKMQLAGAVEKRIQVDSQRQGLTPPPALSTYLSERQMKRAEWANAIGGRTSQTVSNTLATESRATPATGPQTRFDVELRGLGVQPEKHQKAMEAGLGDQVAGAVKVAKIRDALKAIASKNGGELPAQTTFSWRQLGLAPLAARMGNTNADEQVNTQQLLTQATLAYMESLKSLKGIDANAEREKFEQSINTGVAGSTLGALDSAVQRAESSALSTASGFAGGNARRYVDLLKSQQNEPDQTTPINAQGTGYVPPSAKAPDEAQTIQQQASPQPQPQPTPTSQGGSATRPLAESRQELRRAIQSAEDLQGFDADALERIIAFESGGRPDARNPSGATGLIQFMPKVFDGMQKPPGYEGVTHADLADLTVEEQLPLVAAYFRQAGVPADADVGEYYLAVAAPAALGKPDDAVVYPRGSKAWEQNPSWRPAGGGDITAGSIRAKGRKL